MFSLDIQELVAVVEKLNELVCREDDPFSEESNRKCSNDLKFSSNEENVSFNQRVLPDLISNQTLRHHHHHSTSSDQVFLIFITDTHRSEFFFVVRSIFIF